MNIFLHDTASNSPCPTLTVSLQESSRFAYGRPSSASSPWAWMMSISLMAGLYRYAPASTPGYPIDPEDVAANDPKIIHIREVATSMPAAW